MRVAVACALAVLGATWAAATEYFVDGSCPTSGTGTSVPCGASGPFRTIQEGVDALRAGDAVWVRGGVYEERVVVRTECTAAEPCTIGAHETERPVLRGMLRRSDWTAAGGGVWQRAMEATPDELTTQQPDAYHPMTLYQDTGGSVMVPLGYDGDGVTAVRDGHYSYHAATRRLFVNPLGAAAPTDVYVPHVTTLVELGAPAAWVTVRGLRLEGSRGSLLGAVNTGSPLRGIVVQDNELRYFPRFGVHVNGAPGLVLRDNVIEYGGRGLGGFAGGAYGAYGMRLFQIDGALIEGNVVAHLGHGACPWCDPPWDDDGHSVLDEHVYANAIDYKQTAGGRIVGNTVVDVADRGIGLDVSREVVVARNVVIRTRTALSSRTQTPVHGFTGCADNVFSDNVVDRCELGVRIEDDGLLPGASFLARVERTAITRTATRYLVPDRPYVIVADGTASTTLPSTSTSSSIPGSNTSSTITPTTTAPTSTGGSSTVTSATSTTGVSTSTSTTLVPAAVQRLSGRTLLMASHGERAEARRFRLVSRDRSRLTLGGVDAVPALLAQGGVLRTRAGATPAFTAEYPLAAERWRPIDARRPDEGVVYRNPAGPITLVRFEVGRRLLVRGRGDGLRHDLDAAPQTIEVDLQIGPRSYCFAFGGRHQIFEVKRKLLRVSAARPRACRAPIMLPRA